MAAVAVTSQLTQALSFLKDHPKLSCVLLLFLSPPIYRILLYFTPLLLSTALCIFALITLTPYVTATDAEVERQSLLGASSQQLKNKINTSTPSKERKLEHTASGYGKPLMGETSSSSPAAASSVATSVSAAASASSSDSGSSWFSWMNGLNDIGRTWMENKLIEQGLALSEPANRETLLALIEGSFADLLTVKQSPISEIFTADDNHEGAVAATESVAVVESVVLSVEKSDEALKAGATSECAREVYARHESLKEEEIVCAKASSKGAADNKVLIENVVNVETSRGAENQAETISSDVCAVSKVASLAACGVKKMPLNAEPLFDDDEVRKHKPYVAVEHSLPVMDSCDLDPPAATTLLRTPSRIPAPGKLLEASRRMFLKEEQTKTMLPRAPLQASSASKVNQPFKSSFGSMQSKIEIPVSVFKLPTRKFLERSRSIPSKEGSKLSNMSTLEMQAGRKDGQGEMKEGNALHVSDGVEREGVDDVEGVQNAKHGVANVVIGDVNKISAGAPDDGPRFDEDLKVEEAQALVQSELRMLEVELDEVAAKLPKLDETFAYQRTPAKSLSMSHIPINSSPKCNSGLFLASPFKASSLT